MSQDEDPEPNDQANAGMFEKFRRLAATRAATRAEIPTEPDPNDIVKMVMTAVYQLNSDGYLTGAVDNNTQYFLNDQPIPGEVMEEDENAEETYAYTYTDGRLTLNTFTISDDVSTENGSETFGWEDGNLTSIVEKYIRTVDGTPEQQQEYTTTFEYHTDKANPNSNVDLNLIVRSALDLETLPLDAIGFAGKRSENLIKNYGYSDMDGADRNNVAWTLDANGYVTKIENTTNGALSTSSVTTVTYKK
jgi:hypothetical protein